MNQETPGQ